MTERSYSTTDKSTWGDGPWHEEPDKVQWIDAATGLDCLIVRSPMGSLCGYVGLPPGHPAHGRDYDDVDVAVHGDLTFAGACDEDAPEGHGICHVPEPGRPADVWWLGFDCGHTFDVSPAFDAGMRESGMPPLPHFAELPTTYKSLAYVRAEVEALARQLAAR
jgi:hypothetical protein